MEKFDSYPAPWTVAPREGKYYRTRILDALGSEVLDLGHPRDDKATPSFREKKYLGIEDSVNLDAEYFFDNHWEAQETYDLAMFLCNVRNGLAG